MPSGTASQLPLTERIERALVLLAYFIEQDGDKYLPWYEQFERELEEFRVKEDTRPISTPIQPNARRTRWYSFVHSFLGRPYR